MGSGVLSLFFNSGIPEIEQSIDADHDQVQHIENNDQIERIQKLMGYSGNIAKKKNNEKEKAFSLG